MNLPGQFTDDLIARWQEAIAHERRRQQGYGKPIQSHSLGNNRKAVVIGRALMVGSWRTFTDFLLDYSAERIGRQWIADEMKRGSEAHPIGQWASKMKREATSSPLPPSGVTKGRVNNAFRSILSLAYNLYLIEHHYEQYDEPLLERMIKKLRVTQDFFATLSEMNAAAAFLRAGFELRYDNDLHPGHHAEFTARFRQTGRKFSVEVKTRTGQLDETRPSIHQIRLKNKLSQALKKSLPWTRVVFVDINLPDLIGGPDAPELEELLSQVKDAEQSLRISGKSAPSAYLFLINMPFHYNHESLEGATMIGALGFRLSTFQPRAPATFRQIVLAREQHPEMSALIESMQIHQEAPSTFDGQPPEFAFGKQEHPRWIVGHHYVVPDANDNDVLAKLVNASAHPESKTMHGAFELAGQHFIVQSPMTDAEVEVYSRNPETFFGVIQSVGGRANNAYELAEFFYASYKDTPKEKLLEFLKDHPAFNAVQDWSQKDLAIFVCEQWALGAESRSMNKP